VSIGDTLADARRHAGLTVTQVSQQTRIRESIIRDIEQGDFTACGGDFYARGHIRSIAGAVGTDATPLISEYDADHGPVGSMRAADVFQPSRPIKIRERRSPSLALIAVIVLLAVIGFAAYRLVSSHGHSGRPAAAPTTPAAGPSAHASPAAKASATASPTPSDVVIKVSAVEECWVLLTKTSDGSQIYMGVVPAGSSMTWREGEPVSLRLGNPGGIVLTVDGQRDSINTVLPVTLNFSPPISASSSASASPSS
jgi:transcriptional regulator with XRE-family HTH domain